MLPPNKTSVPSHLFGVLVVEHSQDKDVDKGDEERGVGVELLLLHEHVGPVAEVEIAHDEAHPAEGL